MMIVRTYTDAGKSGLRIDGRNALKQLIHDVENGNADFSAILVYDVSRWGRFQDADESAYYEYICRRAKIEVHYCAEQFENDGSPISTIVKGVKRAMAGEYSRELSAKVFIGQCRLIELGFRQGGSPGFGLRRMLRDVTGQQKGMLDRGEQKSIQTDRVILVPGPKEEVEIVRWMYRIFVEDRIVESRLAKMLNERGIATDLGRAWTHGTVHQVLTSEKYVGNNVYNRMSFKLKQKRVVNPPDMWIRGNGAFEPIIPSDLFTKAQDIIRERSRKYTNDELLDQLRKLLEHNGHLSGLLIDEAEGMASSSVYRNRFSSLVRAYKLIAYTPERDYQFIETNRQLRLMYPNVVSNVIERIHRLGGAVHSDPGNDRLTVNDEFTASIVIARCRQRESGLLRWLIRVDSGLNPDITVAVRMDAPNRELLDYYLLPRLDLTFEKLLLAEENHISLETYRFDTLDFFFGMAQKGSNPGGSVNNTAPIVEMIPVDQINVLNPRSRNKIVFQTIVSNISNLGLKRPITVARRAESNEGKPYDLVCGQGRLEAFIALGQAEIPAIVREASKEDCFLMSLVENVARRQIRPLELLREISNLKARGYSTTDIANKIDVHKTYVTGIIHLLKNGEERLIYAVEKGRIPLSVAMQIANADEEGIQQALCQAYEEKTLRGRRLLTVRRIIELRKTNGKRSNPGVRRRNDRVQSAESLVRVYRQEVDRQKLLVKKSQLAEHRLLFIVSALKNLFRDENFLTLLRAEELDSLPAYLAEKIQVSEKV